MKARASARDLKSLNEKKIRNDKKKKKEDKNEDRWKDLERERERRKQVEEKDIYDDFSVNACKNKSWKTASKRLQEIRST